MDLNQYSHAELKTMLEESERRTAQWIANYSSLRRDLELDYLKKLATPDAIESIKSNWRCPRCDFRVAWPPKSAKS